MYALLSKKLVEESKRYQYLKTEVKHKLQTYLKLKCNFGIENYLHILSDFYQRKSFTKFRISNHKLKIETGRYSKPITPLENRICEKCFSKRLLYKL
jgi:hypothetical protein